MSRCNANRKAQAGTEYLLIGGFVFFSILVATSLFYTYSKESYGDIAIAQVNKICNDIVNSAESVYYMGKPARQTLKVDFPAGIYNMSIVRNDPASGCLRCTELRFTMRKKGIAFDVSCSTNIILNGTFPRRSYSQGLKYVVIKAESNMTSIVIPGYP